jgi:hypothetical protein
MNLFETLKGEELASNAVTSCVFGILKFKFGISI